jgi:hypothetical protein
MCQVPQDTATESEPDVQTFSDVAGFLAAVKPGMDLCTSDFTGWAEVQEVRPESAGGSASIRGRRYSDGQLVDVPAGALIDLRGGHCVRIDRVRATIDAQGWEAEVTADRM